MGPKTRTRPRVSRADPVQPHRELTWGHTQVAAVGFPAPMGLDWSPWSEPTPSQPVRGLGARSVTDLPVWKPALVPRDPGRAQGESQGGCRSGPGGQGWVHQRPAAHSRESAADGQQDPPGHRRMLPHRLAPHGDTFPEATSCPPGPCCSPAPGLGTSFPPGASGLVSTEHPCARDCAGHQPLHSLSGLTRRGNSCPPSAQPPRDTSGEEGEPGPDPRWAP